MAMVKQNAGLLGDCEVLLEGTADTVDVSYRFDVGGSVVRLEQHIGKGIRLSFDGSRHCRHCATTVRRLYARQYCYDCFSSLARCDLCFVSPDRCHFHQGTCREPEWAESVCMQPHIVYLANSSGPKIGLTRQGRERHRWADQGASQGLAFMLAPSRRMAGFIEAFYRRQLSDRTEWRRLVSGRARPADLLELHRSLQPTQEALAAYIANEGGAAVQAEWDHVQWLEPVQLVRLSYPINAYSPAQRITLDEQQPAVHANLQGIVGQFLLLDAGAFNFGDHRAMGVELEITDPVAAKPHDGRDQLQLFE